MKVLSLFDGICCARVAIERAGIPIESYHACEIDKYAIQVAKKNYPSTVHLGDVREIKEKKDIDLLIGGSPCQDLSIAKKGRKGLEGDRSGLFWEYLRIRELMQPKYFILENVASMPQKDKDIISEAMGVEPVMFNASLVSAQTRKRLFWTNIPFELPEDCGILLKDILQQGAEIDERFMGKNGKALCVLSGYYKAYPPNAERIQTKAFKSTMVKIGHLDVSYNQEAGIYSTEGKSITLSAKGGGIGANTGLYEVKCGRIVGRRLNEEGKRADNNIEIECKQQVEVRDDEKTNCLSTVQKDNVIVDATTIRKLTPIECERLQGLPDNYTEGISTTQRYKCLGNAFNADVICHIVREIK